MCARMSSIHQCQSLTANTPDVMEVDPPAAAISDISRSDCFQGSQALFATCSGVHKVLQYAKRVLRDTLHTFVMKPQMFSKQQQLEPEQLHKSARGPHPATHLQTQSQCYEKNGRIPSFEHHVVKRTRNALASPS